MDGPERARSMSRCGRALVCALRDGAREDRESNPTIVEPVDRPSILEALAEETRAYHATIPSRNICPPPDPLATDGHFRELEEAEIRRINADFGDQQTWRATSELGEVMATVRALLRDPSVAGIRNYRDKHLAQSLSATHREKSGPLPPVKFDHAIKLFDVQSRSSRSCTAG